MNRSSRLAAGRMGALICWGGGLLPARPRQGRDWQRHQTAPRVWRVWKDTNRVGSGDRMQYVPCYEAVETGSRSAAVPAGSTGGSAGGAAIVVPAPSTEGTASAGSTG